MTRIHRSSDTVLKYQTLNDVVYEAIRKRIADLAIPPEDQLIEHQLAAELGVSKSPVREAFRRLEKTGFIRVVPFKGCFVSPLSVKEFKDALELREMLETYCLTVGLPRYTDEDVREIEKLEDAADKKLQKGNRHAASEFHMKIHRLIVEKAGNELIQKTHTDLIENTLKRYLMLALQEVSNQAETWRGHHRRIFTAIKKRNVQEAVDALREHIRGVMDDGENRRDVSNVAIQTSITGSYARCEVS